MSGSQAQQRRKLDGLAAKPSPGDDVFSVILFVGEMALMRFVFPILLWVVAAWGGVLSLAQEATLPKLRRPVDAVWLVPGQTVLTANSRSGSLSVVDLPTREVVHEAVVGGQPVAVVVLSDNRVAVIDAEGNHLAIWRVNRAPWGLVKEADLPVLRGPSSLVLLPNEAAASTETVTSPVGVSLSVASRWDRSMERVELQLTADSSTEVRRLKLQLPFAPHDQLVLPGGKKLLVADHHGGQLAVVDIENWTLDAIRPLNAHNIRGLAISSNRDAVLISHQILNQQVTTGFEALREGTLIQNVVRVVPLEKLYDQRALLPVSVRTIFLGQTAEGAADPADVVLDVDQNLCVALAGANEVFLATTGGLERQRPTVGTRPTHLLPCPDRRELVVVNTFGDSLSVVDTKTAEVKCEISLGPQPNLSPSDRGEILFHDGRLSLDRWMSCHSCHTDGDSNGLLADTLGDGTGGTPKRVLTLLGGRDANPWAWSGEVRILHEQVTKSVRNTMHGKQLPMTQVNDMVAYLHTLEPAPPLMPATDSPADRKLLEHGRRVFESAGCARCHIPPLTYTSDSMYDVGIHDEAGLKLFNPPSLRGVSQRDRLFHDSRAKSLDDVLDQGHYTQAELSEDDRAALLRFLKSL
ncbi:MAG: cytochrome c peroxidase [Planctomycetaceae bacterium]